MLYNNSRWFITPNLSQPRSSYLFCLPFAGAGASVYHTWTSEFKNSDIQPIYVQYPGRENRIKEPCIRSAETLVKELTLSILQVVGDKTFALYGHSMGALLAFEVASSLALQGKQAECIFVSAKNPPHRPSNIKKIYDLPKAAFIDEMRKFGNLPKEVTDIDELIELIEPIMRADMELLYHYKRIHQYKIHCPIFAIGGIDDPYTTPTSLAEWSEYSSNRFDLTMLDGGHFFIKEKKYELCSKIILELTGKHSATDTP